MTYTDSYGRTWVANDFVVASSGDAKQPVELGRADANGRVFERPAERRIYWFGQAGCHDVGAHTLRPQFRTARADCRRRADAERGLLGS